MIKFKGRSQNRDEAYSQVPKTILFSIDNTSLKRILLKVPKKTLDMKATVMKIIYRKTLTGSPRGLLT